VERSALAERSRGMTTRPIFPHISGLMGSVFPSRNP
jgi:hypothetical protein